MKQYLRCSIPEKGHVPSSVVSGALLHACCPREPGLPVLPAPRPQSLGPWMLLSPTCPPPGAWHKGRAWTLMSPPATASVCPTGLGPGRAGSCGKQLSPACRPGGGHLTGPFFSPVALATPAVLQLCPLGDDLGSPVRHCTELGVGGGADSWCPCYRPGDQGTLTMTRALPPCVTAPPAGMGTLSAPAQGRFAAWQGRSDAPSPQSLD